MTTPSTKSVQQPKLEQPGCLGRLMMLLGLQPKQAEESKLPYRLHEFLSAAELHFYRSLGAAVGDWATICPKVGLGDLFYPKTGDRAENTRYRNRIDRKHVDFVLCDPQSMRPLVGIELDDSSHQRQDRQQRDLFVDQVFAAAGLPLKRVRASVSYDVAQLAAVLRESAGLGAVLATSAPGPAAPAAALSPASKTVSPQTQDPQAKALPTAAPSCPQCGQPMVLRTVRRQGPHFGKQFWGCPGYPQCRGVREL